MCYRSVLVFQIEYINNTRKISILHYGGYDGEKWCAARFIAIDTGIFYFEVNEKETLQLVEKFKRTRFKSLEVLDLDFGKQTHSSK